MNLVRLIRCLKQVLRGERPAPRGKTLAECAIVLARAELTLRDAVGGVYVEVA